MMRIKQVTAMQCLAYAVYAVEMSDTISSDVLTTDSDTSSTGAADGLWTGYDWTDESTNIGVLNGVPYGLNDAVN